MSGLDTSRTEIIIGKEGCDRLKDAHVAVFGIGGVGGHLCEALVRAGIGEITIIDGDTVSSSNVNRQLIATQSSVSMIKTEVMEKRIKDINPDCICHTYPVFYSAENADLIDFSKFDCVADCIDTVKSKIELISRAKQAGVPIISSMGAGNKLHPEKFKISDIYKTENDPLAKTVRHELRARGIDRLTVVWSDEIPLVKSVPPGSISFVPSAAGLVAAGWIVRELLGLN